VKKESIVYDGKNLDDGFYIFNRTTDQTFRAEAYNANKQRIIQDDPPIVPPRMGGIRYVSTEHIGSAGFIYLLIFFQEENFNPPPGIGIISGSSSSGGGGGISLFGFGASGSGSVTVTEAYSQPAAAAQMNLRGYKTPSTRAGWANTHQWSVLKIQGEMPNTDVHDGKFGLEFADVEFQNGYDFLNWAGDIDGALRLAARFVTGR
jgi:hypothetical protein